MDYYFYDEIDQENDPDDDEHDTYQVQMRCLSKARHSCNEMLEALRRTVLEEVELTRSELEARHSSLTLKKKPSPEKQFWTQSGSKPKIGEKSKLL